MRKLIFAAAVAAISFGAGAAIASTPYDGEWDVGITVDSGQCDSGYLFPIKVSNGAISYNGTVKTSARGEVGKTGAVNVHFTHDKDEVQAIGQLSGSSGNGKWASPTLRCSGRWQATRR